MKIRERSAFSLVSYLRTGTHWLMLLFREYRTEVMDITLMPTIRQLHALGVAPDVDKVIYLYREDVIDVVFSNLMIKRLPLDNEELIRLRVLEYVEHMNYWRHTESRSSDKVEVSFNNMKEGFVKALRFMNIEPDLTVVDRVFSRVDKEFVRESDPDMIIISEEYEAKRQAFRKAYGAVIDSMVEGIM